MEHPKGYEVHVKMRLVCKLKKSFYGLKQCHPSAIKDWMLILGAMKKCLDGTYVILILYVDDILIVGEKQR